MGAHRHSRAAAARLRLTSLTEAADANLSGAAGLETVQLRAGGESAGSGPLDSGRLEAAQQCPIDACNALLVN